MESKTRGEHFDASVADNGAVAVCNRCIRADTAAHSPRDACSSPRLPIDRTPRRTRPSAGPAGRSSCRSRSLLQSDRRRRALLWRLQGHEGALRQPKQLRCPQALYGTHLSLPALPHQQHRHPHDLADPVNFGTILGISAITVGADSHSAYGPGLKGFGKSVGVSLLQDATAQFFGAFAIPVIVHQDPRYFRMPHAPFGKRVVYSISRTVVSRSDSGKSMPNYATLLNYPIGAELANLYVPGIHPDAPSTVARIFTGYALDPVNGLINEFLPDVASHVHVRIIVVQRILNNVARGNNVPGT